MLSLSTRLAAAIHANAERLGEQQIAEMIDAEVKPLVEALESYGPPMPPMLDGETPEEYTDRLTGADGTSRRPYLERRFRQCSIGYHGECSQAGADPDDCECECPCHQFERLRDTALAAARGQA